MKKSTRIGLGIVIALAAAALVLLVPLTKRQISITTTATEYRLDDPDYTVEQTVSIQGTDKRNLLGWGEYTGTFAVSGFEGGDTVIVVHFPKDSEAPWVSGFEAGTGFNTDFSYIAASRDWSDFAALSRESDPAFNRVLVSGGTDRATAMALAKKLYAGTMFERRFQ